MVKKVPRQQVSFLFFASLTIHGSFQPILGIFLVFKHLLVVGIFFWNQVLHQLVIMEQVHYLLLAHLRSWRRARILNVKLEQHLKYFASQGDAGTLTAAPTQASLAVASVLLSIAIATVTQISFIIFALGHSLEMGVAKVDAAAGFRVKTYI